VTSLLVPSRFCGPPSSGNGGWTAGALAALVHPGPAPWPAIQVTLRMPPPLDTELAVVEADGHHVAAYDGGVVAEGHLTEDEPTACARVDADTARAAEARYAGLRSHPFPTCFACGTGRDDGLRIFPGLVDRDPARVAATWTPDESVRCDFHELTDERPRASLPVTWAALDCIGGWAGDLEERLMVLGRMTAVVHRLPVIGEEHVVVGEARGQDGRKSFTASSVFDATGEVVGQAHHTWIAVDPKDFA